jgi:hypothetical protein
MLPMQLSIGEIYASTLRALKANILVYMLLLVWGLLQGIILLAILTIGGIMWVTSFLALSASGSAAAAVIFTIVCIALALLVLAFLGAATKGGLIGFGAAVRRGRKATTLDFLRGILSFTFPLFAGGILVGLLSSVPLVLYIVFLSAFFQKLPIDIFTSGWNFSHALSLLGFFWNVLLVSGVFQMLIFFWISPWDEMVVLYRIGVFQALGRSFKFVFSRENFFRVIGLTILNAAIAFAALVLGNLHAFTTITGGPLLPYFWMLVNPSPSLIASLLQFLLLPFFAFSQLYLLPIPETRPVTDPDHSLISVGAPGALSTTY